MKWLYILLFLPYLLSANSKVDSLKQDLTSSKDTNKAILLYKISNSYQKSNTDSAIYYANKAYLESKNLDYLKGTVKSLIAISHLYINIGKYSIADSITKELLDYSTKHNHKGGIGKAYFHLGLSCDYQGLYSQAVDYYIQSLRIMEEMGNMQGVASSYMNIGIVYYFEKMYGKTLHNYKKAYQIVKKHNIEGLEENLLNNIATVYYQNNELDSALTYYKKSLNLINNNQDKTELGTILGNIGLVFDEQEKFDSSIYYHTKALESHLHFNNQYGVATTYKDLGKLQIHTKKYDLAIKNLHKSINLGEKINALQVVESAYGHIHKAYFKNNDLEKAYHYQKLYSELKDSIISEKSSKQILEVETKYETEKKEKEILKLNEKNALKEVELLKRESDNNRNTIVFLSVLIIFFIVIISVFYSLKQKKKANSIIKSQNEELNQTNEELAAQRDEIENQKNKIESAHKEIRDSIDYAKRIQNAILPADSLIKELIPESFVFYKPKDIVAGDFYWLEQVANSVLFAAADCTGHGVPGAMVSVVCHNAMNRTVREFKLTEPGKILDKTREIVLEELSKSNEDVKDGMDIALCLLETKKLGNQITYQLSYAGAHNPLWIVRNNEILETKADKQPIGKFDNPTPFITHEIKLQKGDSIYIFSDGYIDQFGGEKDKKFGSRKLKELLVSIQDKSMEEQNSILNTEITSWMNQSNNEQLDDICVIGVKI